jgi:hypothetical protein
MEHACTQGVGDLRGILDDIGIRLRTLECHRLEAHSQIEDLFTWADRLRGDHELLEARFADQMDGLQRGQTFLLRRGIEQQSSTETNEAFKQDEARLQALHAKDVDAQRMCDLERCVERLNVRRGTFVGWEYCKNASDRIERNQSSLEEHRLKLDARVEEIHALASLAEVPKPELSGKMIVRQEPSALTRQVSGELLKGSRSGMIEQQLTMCKHASEAKFPPHDLRRSLPSGLLSQARFSEPPSAISRPGPLMSVQPAVRFCSPRSSPRPLVIPACFASRNAIMPLQSIRPCR